MDILKLNDLVVLDVKENLYDYLITAEAKERPCSCIKCNGSNLIKHSQNTRIVSDVPIHNMRTKIELIHRRYKCKECNYSFYELLSSIDQNSRMTKRLLKAIQQESLVKPFTDIEERYAVSNMTVRRIFDKHIEELSKARKLVAPRVLGIDEAHLNNKMRGVLTDIENNRLIEMTEDRTKPYIKAAILSLEGWENIEVVTMDMAVGYRNTVYELLPHALCVIDKFHVIQYAQVALNRIRVDYKNSLAKVDRNIFHKDKWLLQSNKEDLSEENLMHRDAILEQSEPLMTAYWVKEMLRDMYKMNKRDAYQYYYQIEMTVPKKGKEYKALRRDH